MRRITAPASRVRDSSRGSAPSKILRGPEWTGRTSGCRHVEAETVTADLRLGGRQHHVKVLDDDPSNRVTADGVFTEFFSPDVFVTRERITGDPGIDPDVPLELRVEFLKTGRDNTLVRIIQGPYDKEVADFHTRGWERELVRLQAHLSDQGAGVTP